MADQTAKRDLFGGFGTGIGMLPALLLGLALMAALGLVFFAASLALFRRSMNLSG